MKKKMLIITLAIVLVLLFYNLICYKILNNSIDKDTRKVISSYIKNNNYEFIRALKKDNNTISVFIKSDNIYYQFILDKYNYQVREINNKIPAYIK